MSETVKRAGSMTILLWLFAMFTVPTIGYIASNALQMPTVVEQLKHLVKSNQEVVVELKELRVMNIQEENLNRSEHKAIAEMLISHSYGIKDIKEDCGNTIKDIEKCQQEIERIKNGH